MRIQRFDKAGKNKLQRMAATTVEFAVVAPIVFMMIFGVIEWCRYIMARNVTENAVREAARFTVARTDTLQTGINVAGIQAHVQNFTSRMGTQLSNIQIFVYKTDVFGQPTSNAGVVVPNRSTAGAFDQTKFGDYICIELIADYKPALPNFLFMNSITQIRATAIMCSEGG
jgi:hypothetical protein